VLSGQSRQGAVYRAGVVVVAGTVHKQAWVDMVAAPMEQPRPGLWSIPDPMRDNPLRHVIVDA
jgi:hypothetical protein